MSYQATSSGTSVRNLIADLGAGRSLPVTLAGWCKFASWPSSIRTLFSLSALTDLESSGAVMMQTSATGQNWTQRATSTADSSISLPVWAGTTDQFNGVWVPWAAVFSGASDRTIYIADIVNTSTDTVTRDSGNALRYLTGFSLTQTSTQSFLGQIAELAVYGKALNSTEVNTLFSGTAATGVASADLLAYWPLNVEQTTHADMSGNGGPTLTVNEPRASFLYNEDHPTITSSVTYVKPSTEPLYYGATRLDSKSNIQWTLKNGHTGIDGTLINSGLTASTSATGVLTLPELVEDETGAPTTPVTLSLYWEEGTEPVVDRSLIVKTTLVEDV